MTLERGQAAFEAQRWADAATLLASAATDPTASAADIERLAVARYLVGDDAGSDAAWERAYAQHRAAGDLGSAGRCAFWLGLLATLRGSTALANGWLARAERLAADLAADHPVRGLLLMVEAWFSTLAGDQATAVTLAERAAAIGEAHGDADLLALAQLTHGEALVSQGDSQPGVALLDEAMVGVATGGVSPVATGIVYCGVIDACMAVLDLRRAGEWTAALSRWCDSQPDLVPYRGVCLVHRSQILQAHGSWSAAEEEVDRARAHLSAPPHPALGAALYQRAELHRVRGELDAAEALYRDAVSYGYEAKPGLALLRLDQGRTDDAARLVRRMLEETNRDTERAPVLDAATTIFLAARDHPAAAAVAEELGEIAERSRTDVLQAMASRARGAVLLAHGDAVEALALLRASVRVWNAAQLPYQAAQTSLLVADACRRLGDADGAALEEDGARAVLRRLAGDSPAAGPPDGLTERECEVLRLVAEGATNRDIGAALSISEHTVARHIQNVFAKTGLRSRAAAASYAHERGIVSSGGSSTGGQI